jgi:hypothetical protein
MLLPLTLPPLPDLKLPDVNEDVNEGLVASLVVSLEYKSGLLAALSSPEPSPS